MPICVVQQVGNKLSSTLWTGYVDTNEGIPK